MMVKFRKLGLKGGIFPGEEIEAELSHIKGDGEEIVSELSHSNGDGEEIVSELSSLPYC